MNKIKIISILLLSSILTIMVFNYSNKNNSSKKDKLVINSKLNQLNNTDKKLSFFNTSYLDRYIEYKNKNINYSNEKIVINVNIGIDNNFYTNIKECININTTYVLVNKFYKLNKNYIPKNLEYINSKYGNGMLVKEARIAFEDLSKAALNDNMRIMAVSAYRSYNYQNNLYDNYVKSDGKEKADTYSARPGHSEHQTGLAIDVSNGTLPFTSFGKTKEFEWMLENAYKYGFILRYTKEYETITGYITETWHYRYVGIKIASYIYNNPMSFEEYYIRFIEKENP